jgi:anti-anti-sigma regulatory factor
LKGKLGITRLIQMLRDFISHSEGTTTISINEKDLAYNDGILIEFDSILDEYKPNLIVLDLIYVHKMSSSAIGRLVNIHRYITEENSLKLSIININQNILKTLKSVKVDGVLGIGN